MQEISIYNGDLADKNDVLIACKTLSYAFPKMEKEFFALLTKYILKNQFTKERLRDAVDYVIENFKYKELNIADIISFDSKVKLFSYKEVCIMIDKGYSFDDFEIVEINGKKYRKWKQEI